MRGREDNLRVLLECGLDAHKHRRPQNHSVSSTIVLISPKCQVFQDAKAKLPSTDTWGRLKRELQGARTVAKQASGRRRCGTCDFLLYIRWNLAATHSRDWRHWFLLLYLFPWVGEWQEEISAVYYILITPLPGLCNSFQETFIDSCHC